MKKILFLLAFMLSSHLIFSPPASAMTANPEQMYQGGAMVVQSQVFMSNLMKYITAKQQGQTYDFATNYQSELNVALQQYNQQTRAYYAYQQQQEQQQNATYYQQIQGIEANPKNPQVQNSNIPYGIPQPPIGSGINYQQQQVTTRGLSNLSGKKVGTGGTFIITKNTAGINDVKALVFPDDGPTIDNPVEMSIKTEYKPLVAYIINNGVRRQINVKDNIIVEDKATKGKKEIPFLLIYSVDKDKNPVKFIEGLVHYNVQAEEVGVLRDTSSTPANDFKKQYDEFDKDAKYE